MRKPRLNRWPNLKETEGLLLVAQRIQECLFDYTLDSYKAPTLNTHTRCLELQHAIKEVAANTFSNKNLKPLVEELAQSIKNDVAARTLLGPHASTLSNVNWWEINKPDRLSIQADFLHGFLWRQRYERQLISHLKNLVSTPKQKTLILETTTNLVVEWMLMGFDPPLISQTPP